MKRAILGIGALASACVFALVFGACGSDNGGNNDGGDGGKADQTTGLPDASVFPCDGCTPFPPLGTTDCAPTVLGPATLAYPLDGMLLPPNMNVLEVQFVPPAGATLFEVDFENAITDVSVETQCNAGARRARRREPRLRRHAPAGRVERHRQHQPRRRSRHTSPCARPIDGSCVSTSADEDQPLLREGGSRGRHLLLAVRDLRRHRRQDGRHLQPRLRHVRSRRRRRSTPRRRDGTCVGCHNLSRDGVAHGARDRRSRRRRRVRRREDARARRRDAHRARRHERCRPASRRSRTITRR